MTNGSLNSYHFSFWLTLFATLLIAVPISIWFGFIFLAKFIGVLILVLLIFAMRNWFKQARIQNKRLERVVLTTNDLYTLEQIIPAFKYWPSSDRHILVNQLGLVLAEVQFKGAWSNKTKLLTCIGLSMATYNNAYYSKLGWVCSLDENQIVELQQTVFVSFQLPSEPILSRDFQELQQHQYIASLKKQLF